VKKIHFVSLGCPKNRVDTEVMLGVSALRGYELVAEAEEAEIVVVNSCGFIGPAKEESIDTILEMGRLKEEGSLKKLVVAGCLSQRYPEELAREMPEVDHFLGSSDMLKLGAILDRPSEAARMLVGNPAEQLLSAQDPRELSRGSFSAYLKIAEGCNRRCSFCAIPSFRGKQRSRSIEDVVCEAERLIDLGVVELNLVSQDTVAYGRDLRDGTDLAKLTEALAELPGARWVRLFYLYPETLKEELLTLLAEHPKVLPYIDMPLQHAADGMLRRMRRGHGGDRLRRVVDRLRERVPELTFRSAFIVGHPGETEAEFEELLAFVEWARFDRLGVFRYSSEEGTAAHDELEAMGEEVPEEVAEERAERLLEAQRPITEAKTKALIGQELEVLVEGQSEESEHLLRGRHRGQAPEIDGQVILANGTAKPGAIRKAFIVAAAEHDLVADLADEEGRFPEPPPGSDPRPLRGERRGKKVRLRTL
jgi:ribosomal protein S12 methylthiotransferase